MLPTPLPAADIIFAEAMATLDDYRSFASSLTVPLLANLTEFGYTPLFSLEEMKQAGVAIVLYPLSAFLAMSAAAAKVYQTIRQTGSQKNVLQITCNRCASSCTTYWIITLPSASPMSDSRQGGYRRRRRA